jgi:UDP-GlcNAc3NAcA epimerase
VRIATVVGARPQFIKAAVVSRAVADRPGISEVLIHTGQHFDENMSEVFFREMSIPPPRYHLGIRAGSHGEQTGRMLMAIEAVLLESAPDCVLVYGDTNSTLAGALAAVKLHIPVAHVEAGLRSFNRRMPEEINRILTDHASDILFAPTEHGVRNLLAEGVRPEAIRLVGDVMYDAALYYGSRAAAESRVLVDLGLERMSYALATVHRAENTDHPERLESILEALTLLSGELPVVLPLHPRTRKILDQHGITLPVGDRLRVIEPVSYLDMIQLEQHAALILTDSGGVQKEAFFHRVPCITLREETEWSELVELGWNRLAPPTLPAARIAAAARESLFSRGEEAQPYGRGKTAQAIVETLLAVYGQRAGED